MSTLLVVRDGGGYVVAHGPSDGSFDPTIPVGCTSAVEADPDLTPPPPTKEQRIANVLATTGKGKDRTLIQQVISFAEMVAAPMLATQYSVTLELAIMGLYARNKTYRECKDAETAIEAIEDEP